MPEFVICDSFWDHDLIIVSENQKAASTTAGVTR